MFCYFFFFHFASIDPDEIVSGNIEAILAILWALIWHYSIASTIIDCSQINNTIDSYESKKHRYFVYRK